MLRMTVAAAALAAVMAQTQNIVQIAQSNPDLSDLVFSLQAGGLVSTLSGPGPFTVFAPINQAFDALGPNILSWVLNSHNVAQLDNVLTYHAVSGAVYSNNLQNNENVTTLDKLAFTVHIVGQDVFLIDATGQPAKVIQANIKASNGVVHIIDKVLIPSNLALPKNDIVTTAVGASELSTLVTALKTANLVEALSAPNGPFTVFAPTNAAFNQLPAGTLAYLLAHPTELAEVLKYHVVNGRFYASNIYNLEEWFTLEQQPIVAVIQGGNVLINANATVVVADIDCFNGVVHEINWVLIPSAVGARMNAWAASQNIVQIAQADPNLSTLVTAVSAAGLVSTLEGAGPFTVLAPLNTGFADLPGTFLAWLLQPANIKTLQSVLTYHVIAGNVTSNQLHDGEQVTTVEGQNITVNIFANQVFFNHVARVVQANILASNGVIHVIDNVLLPQNAVASKQESVSALMARLRGARTA